MNDLQKAALRQLNYTFTNGAIIDASGNYVPNAEYNGVTVESAISKEKYDSESAERKDLENRGFKPDPQSKHSLLAQKEIFKQKENLQKPTTLSFNPENPIATTAVTELFNEGKIPSKDPIIYNKIKKDLLNEKDPVAGYLAKDITGETPNKKDIEEDVPTEEEEYAPNDPIAKMYGELAPKDKEAIAKGENVDYIQTKLRQQFPGKTPEELKVIQEQLLTKYKGQFTSEGDDVKNENLAKAINEKYSAEKKLEEYQELKSGVDKLQTERENIEKEFNNGKPIFYDPKKSSSVKHNMAIKLVEKEGITYNEAEKIAHERLMGYNNGKNKEEAELEEKLRPYYTDYQNKVLRPEYSAKISEIEKNKALDITKHVESVTGLSLDQLNQKYGENYTPGDLLEVFTNKGPTFNEMKTLTQQEITNKKDLWSIMQTRGDDGDGHNFDRSNTITNWDNSKETYVELLDQIDSYQTESGYNPFKNKQRSTDNLTLGLSSFVRDMKTSGIIAKLDEGKELTNSEKAIFDTQFSKQMYEQLGIPQSDWYEISQGFTETVKFMIGMGLSGGFGGAIKGSIQKTLTKAVSNKVKNQILLRVATSATKATASGVGALGQAVIMPTTYEAVGNTMVDDVEIEVDPETGEEKRVTTKQIYDKLTRAYDAEIASIENNLNKGQYQGADEAKAIQTIENLKQEKSSLKPQASLLGAFSGEVLNTTKSVIVETALTKALNRVKKGVLGGSINPKTGDYIPDVGKRKWAGRIVDKSGKAINNTTLVKSLKKSKIVSLHQANKPLVDRFLKSTGLNTIGGIPEEMLEEVVEQLIPSYEAGGFYMDSYEQQLDELSNTDFYRNTAAVTAMLGGSKSVGHVLASVAKSKTILNEAKRDRILNKSIKGAASEEEINTALKKHDLGNFTQLDLDTKVLELRTEADKTKDLDTKKELNEEADFIESNKFFNIALNNYKKGKGATTKRALTLAMKNPNLSPATKVNMENTLDALETIDRNYPGVSEMHNSDKILSGVARVRLNNQLAETARKEFNKSSADPVIIEEYKEHISKAFDGKDADSINMNDKKNQEILSEYLNNSKVSTEVVKHHINGLNKDGYLESSREINKVINEMASFKYQTARAKEADVYDDIQKDIYKTYGSKETSIEQEADIWDKHIKGTKVSGIDKNRMEKVKNTVLYDKFETNLRREDLAETLVKEQRKAKERLEKENPGVDIERKVAENLQLESLLPPELQNPEESQNTGNIFESNEDLEFDLPTEDSKDESLEKQKALQDILAMATKNLSDEKGGPASFSDLMNSLLVSQFQSGDAKLIAKKIKYYGKIFEAAGLGDSFAEAYAQMTLDAMNSDKVKPKVTTETELQEVPDTIVNKVENTAKKETSTGKPVVTKIVPDRIESEETANTRVRYKALDSTQKIVEVLDKNGNPTGRLKVVYTSKPQPQLNVDNNFIDIKEVADPDKNLEGELVTAKVIKEEDYSNVSVTERDSKGIPITDENGIAKTITFDEWVIRNQPKGMSLEEFQETEMFISNVPIVYVNKRGKNIGFVEDLNSINAFSVEAEVDQVDFDEEGKVITLEGIDVNNISEAHQEVIDNKKKEVLQVRKNIKKGESTFEITSKSPTGGFETFWKDESGAEIPPTSLSEADPESIILKTNADGDLTNLEGDYINLNIINQGDFNQKNKPFYLTHIHTTKDGEKVYRMHPVFSKNKNNENKISDEQLETLQWIASAFDVISNGENSAFLSGGKKSSGAVKQVTLEEAKSIRKQVLQASNNRIDIANFSSVASFFDGMGMYRIDNSNVAKNLKEKSQGKIDLTVKGDYNAIKNSGDVEVLSKSSQASTEEKRKAAINIFKLTNGRVNLLKPTGKKTLLGQPVTEVDSYLADTFYRQFNFVFSPYDGQINYVNSRGGDGFNRFKDALMAPGSTFQTPVKPNYKFKDLPTFTVTKNDEGGFSLELTADNYEDHLKKNLSTNVVSHNVGTKSNPKTSTEPQKQIILTPTKKIAEKTIEENVNEKIVKELPPEKVGEVVPKEVVEDSVSVDEAVEEGMKILEVLGRPLTEVIDERVEKNSSTPNLSSTQEISGELGILDVLQLKNYIVSLLSEGRTIKEAQVVFDKMVAKNEALIRTKLKNYSSILSTQKSERLERIVKVLNSELIKVKEINSIKNEIFEKGRELADKNEFITNRKDGVDENSEEVADKNYSKGSNEDHGIEKVGTKLKRIFSRITNKKTGVLGVPLFENFNNMYAAVQNILSNNLNTTTDFAGQMEILALHKEAYPWMEGLINELNQSSSDTQKKFVVNMYRHAVKAKSVMFERLPGGDIKSEVWASNSNSAKRKVLSDWKNNFDKSKVSVEGTLNPTRLKYLLKKYNDNLEFWMQPDATVAQHKELRSWLSEFGITLSDKTFKALTKGEMYLKEKGKLKQTPFIDLFKKNQKNLFYNLSQFAAKHAGATENIDYLSNVKNHPHSDMNSILDALSTLEIKFNPTHNSVSRYVGGKSLTEAELPTFFYEQVKKLLRDGSNGSEYIKKLRETAFANNSLTLELLETNEEFRQLFTHELIDLQALFELSTNNTSPSDVTDLSDYDYDFMTRALFQNNRANKIELTKDGIPMRVASMPLPTFSDKGRMMTSQTVVYDLFSMGVFFDTEGGYKFGEEVSNLIYNRLVVPELNRIIEHKKKGTGTNIKGYDKGAERFNLIPGLNTIKGKSGTSAIEFLSDPANQSLIAFKEEFYDSSVSLLETSFKKEAASNVITHKSVVRDSINAKEYLNKNKVYTPEQADMIAELDFIINSNISTMENMQAIIADPAMFFKSKRSKEVKSTLSETQEEISTETGINLGKRLAAMIAPGRILAGSEDNQYLQIFLKDSEVMADGIPDLIKMFYGSDSITSEVETMLEEENIEGLKDLFPRISDYFSIESTDAQEYTTMKEHLWVLMADGAIENDVYKSILDKLDKGEDLEGKELDIVFQPIKPVYTGTMLDEEQGVNRFLYIKSSSFPLLPQLTRDNPKLEALRTSMESLEKLHPDKTVRASYQTANKVGALTDPVDIDDPKQLENLVNLEAEGKNYLTLDRSNFKIQQDIPQKKGKVTLGTQIFKLLFGDGVLDLGGFSYQGKPMTGPELHDEFVKNYSEIIESEKTALFEELGIDSEGKAVDLEYTLNRFSDILKREATSRDFPTQDIEALNLVQELSSSPTEDDTTTSTFKMPLWLLSNSNKFEAMLNSIVANRIFKTKLPGNSFVVGSPNGFELKNTQASLLEDKNLLNSQLEGTSEIPDCI